MCLPSPLNKIACVLNVGILYVKKKSEVISGTKAFLINKTPISKTTPCKKFTQCEREII
jgi:hypothetical protein